VAGVGDGGGLVVAAGCCGCWGGLLSEKKADVMADAVDMTSASGAGADGRCMGASPPTIADEADEMKPEMLEKKLMTALLSDRCYATVHTKHNDAFKTYTKEIK